MRFGIDELLPPELTLDPRPGCPVCVTPVEIIDKALAIAARPEVIFCSFGDMLRVPGLGGATSSPSRRAGGDVRIVYSPLDALALAERHPDREVVFFAVGFETTAPGQRAWRSSRRAGAGVAQLLAARLARARAAGDGGDPRAHRRGGWTASSPPATSARSWGSTSTEPLAARYRVPIVVTGFEPLDLLQGIHMCVSQLEEGRAEVENQYARAVRHEGNAAGARHDRARCSRSSPRAWRGIGAIPASGLGAARTPTPRYDAERRFGVAAVGGRESPECRSGARPPGAAQAARVPRVRHALHARARRSARPWCRPRARAPPTTATGGRAPGHRERHDDRD